ncbi:MAG: hypothetical protein IPM82_27805 [Saprospiraceae bacterium]|nr:hypothetical protein [Saprospiraceae bacterium]
MKNKQIKPAELIEQSKDFQVLCRCLDILNQRKTELAAAKACELIEQSKDHQVLCRCLDILNQRKPELAAAKASN